MKKNTKYQIDDFTFKHKIKTRFKDLDAFHHVNNATFLSYIEDARMLFFKRWNMNTKEKSLIVASITIDYISQLHHPSKLIIGQKISRLGTKSFDILSVIFLDKKPICSSTVTIVCYNFINKQTTPLFQEIKEDFNI